MHKSFAAFRTLAALALVLSLVAGLFSVRDVSAQDATPVVEPSASASADAPSDNAMPSATASANPALPAIERDVIKDGTVITGTIVEDDDRAGEFDYFVDPVDTVAEGDIRSAGEGEQYYYVVALVGAKPELVPIDEGPTDAQGMVMLEIPAEGRYFIYEQGDLSDSIFGSDEVVGPAAFLGIEYVAEEDGIASAAPSAAALAPIAGEGGGTTTNGGTTSGGGTTSLPNTGAGADESGATMIRVLFTLMAVAGVVAAGFGLYRRAA